MGSEEPAQEYRRRLERCREEAQRWGRIERAVSLSRLIVMVALLVTAWLSIQSELFSPWWAAFS